MHYLWKVRVGLGARKIPDFKLVLVVRRHFCCASVICLVLLMTLDYLGVFEVRYSEHVRVFSTFSCSGWLYSLIVAF